MEKFSCKKKAVGVIGSSPKVQEASLGFTQSRDPKPSLLYLELVGARPASASPPCRSRENGAGKSPVLCRGKLDVDLGVSS